MGTDDKTQEEKSEKSTLYQALVKDPKNLVALIMAITALITAVTSLVKAFDKSVEKQSYETLAGHIKQLQDNQKLLASPVASSSAEPAVVVAAPTPSDSETPASKPMPVAVAAASPGAPASVSPTTAPSASVTVALARSATPKAQECPEITHPTHST
jgi:type II secretory pathway pseudopilin PulG